MSVPKDKRTDGVLAVNVAARSACVYLLKITSNEKHFPMNQQWFCQKLRETALEIDLKCWEANNIYVADSMQRYNARLALQAEAADKCTEMLELINIARSVYHMQTKRYWYLTNQYSDLRKQIRNWYSSDKERLKPTLMGT